MKKATLGTLAVAVDVAAAASIAMLPAAHLGERPGVLLLLMGLAALAGSPRIRIPSLRIHLIANETFVLCALAVLGPMPAVLVALAGVLGASVGKAHRSNLVRFAFNLGAVPLSAAVAAWTFLALGGYPGASLQVLLWPLAVATLVYFLLNTSLVAVAVTLEKRQSFLSTWTGSFAWMAAGYFVSLCLAVGLILVLQHLGPGGLALGIPPCWLLVSFHRAHKQRFEEQERRVTESQKLSAELEHTLERLQGTLDHVKRLQGLLPICMHCKRIRDDTDTWQRVETYIAEHSEATFTHSLCRDCRTAHYPKAETGDTGLTA